jgi:hypothetical protein
MHSFADPIASIDRKKNPDWRPRYTTEMVCPRASQPHLGDRESLPLSPSKARLITLFWLCPAPVMERDPLARLGANPSRDQGRSRFPYIDRFVLESGTLFPGLIATSYKYLIAWYVGFFFLEPARERNWCRSVWFSRTQISSIS